MADSINLDTFFIDYGDRYRSLCGFLGVDPDTAQDPATMLDITKQLQDLRKELLSDTGHSYLGIISFYTNSLRLLRVLKQKLRDERSFYSRVKYNTGFGSSHEKALHHTYTEFLTAKSILELKDKLLWRPSTWKFTILRWLHIPHEQFLPPNGDIKQYRLQRALLRLTPKATDTPLTIEALNFEQALAESVDELDRFSTQHWPLVSVIPAISALNLAKDDAKKLNKAFEYNRSSSVKNKRQNTQRIAEISYSIKQHRGRHTLIPITLVTDQGRLSVLVEISKDTSGESYTISLYDNNGPTTKYLNGKLSRYQKLTLDEQAMPIHRFKNVPTKLVADIDFIRGLVAPATQKHKSIEQAVKAFTTPLGALSQYAVVNACLTPILAQACERSIISTYLLDKEGGHSSGSALLQLFAKKDSLLDQSNIPIFIADQVINSAKLIKRAVKKAEADLSDVVVLMNSVRPTQAAEIKESELGEYTDSLMRTGKKIFQKLIEVLASAKATSETKLESLLQQESILQKQVDHAIPKELEQRKTLLQKEIESCEAAYIKESGQKKSVSHVAPKSASGSTTKLCAPSYFFSSAKTKKAYAKLMSRQKALSTFENKLVEAAGNQQKVIEAIFGRTFEYSSGFSTSFTVKALEEQSKSLKDLLKELSKTRNQIIKQEHFLKCASAA